LSGEAAIGSPSRQCDNNQRDAATMAASRWRYQLMLS
jgi:hypothetical protein